MVTERDFYRRRRTETSWVFETLWVVGIWDNRDFQDSHPGWRVLENEIDLWKQREQSERLINRQRNTKGV